jgi:hypothetical protein
LICRLVLGSVVYNLCHTRNELRHEGISSIEEQILKQVMWEVRTRLVGKRDFPRTKKNRMLCFVEFTYYYKDRKGNLGREKITNREKKVSKCLK